MTTGEPMTTITGPQDSAFGRAVLAYARHVNTTAYTFAGHAIIGLRSALTNETLTAALDPGQVDELIADLTAARDAIAPAGPHLRRERRDGTGGRRSTDTAA